MRRHARAGVAAVAVALVAACGSSGGTSAPAPSVSPSASSSTGAAGQLYVSVGDSYASGAEAVSATVTRNTRNGFAYQLPGIARAKGYDLALTNFGCGGATTTSMLSSNGCPPGGLGPGATPYTGTQEAAAETFLRAHRGQVALVTVSIGGNDITSCAGAANPTTCLVGALATVRTNLAKITTGLRDAAGPDVRIVGLTYPDVLLGNYVTQPDGKSLASLSVTAFRQLVNPTLKAGYEAVNGTFVDVTAASGGYEPFTTTTTLAPYGTIPTAVAKVCDLTFYCEYGNIHPRTNGYTLIANLIAATLPRR